MTAKKEESTSAPCPPVEDLDPEDSILNDETDADYTVEETNAKEVPAE